jgi:uncharacterized membrane protein
VTEARLRLAALVLSVLGIGVAGYLTFIHFFDLDAVCLGGGGGCERVQSSDQSKLLGIPVALLGLGAYVVLLATSLLRTETARIVAALTALVGFGFSAYLTYQSITVIDATCQWCLASAAIMTVLAVVCVLRLLRADVVPAGGGHG